MFSREVVLWARPAPRFAAALGLGGWRDLPSYCAAGDPFGNLGG